MKKFGTKMVLLVPALWASLALADGNKQTFEKLESNFAASFNKSDAAAVAENYAEDAIFLPQEGDIVNGRGAIEEMWKGYVKNLSDLSLNVVEVRLLTPSIAQEDGTFTMMTREQTPRKLVGKYATLWRRVGDKWEIVNDIINYVPGK